ncbi:NAD(P)/FAD-dependent oxidoreductase [Deinococcus humi]|uniref:Glycine/D-amino acid oxidase-like deaminating enzyme n=1 Tax=Deinococcus humi TaxID=662880 RepID=A0A7W8NEC2_9DEIO|nr:FAD-binding oxidoreductase [Deinococcus humi]MBB5364169.1 glycine/D-amino acid oxidase-like deaminating enzyme [Deinococcus humi]GGO38664.1 FAD-dependent oxidoreductase [Deinococcus humi]
MPIPSPAPIVVIGGGILGCATAYFLARHADAPPVVVLEPDPSYARSSTPRSASAIRTQFHLGANVILSRFGYDFYKHAEKYLSVNGEPVDLDFEDCPYLVLAAPEGVSRLREAQAQQVKAGARVAFLTVEALTERLAWLRPDGIGAGTLGEGGEGWFDPRRALAALRRKATSLGVTFLPHRAVAMDISDGRVKRVHLDDGNPLEVDSVVNAAGAQAGRVAALAGVALPVESRKRSAFVFQVDAPPAGFMNLVEPLPDGRGMYVRPYKGGFMAVTSPRPAQDPDTLNLDVDRTLFEEVLRPALARRVRGFERLTLVDAWAGHYELNTFDQNAVIGAHPTIRNLIFACGLSGHGVMHAPGIGRGVAELLLGGQYTTLDLSPFRFERLLEGVRLDDVQPSEQREHAAGI